MYENKYVERELDPVHVYKVYAEKRTPSMLEADTPFYLSINCSKTLTHEELKDSCWFKAQPMGVNKLITFLKELGKAANITQKKKKNHAGRKTLVQKLENRRVAGNQIIQVTRHKNIQSLNNCNQLRERQQKNISKILSSSGSASTSGVAEDMARASHSYHLTPSCAHS